ncbi:MAG: hypothetical protein ABL958_11505, partial [Bdellovibrionia bacterium]
SEDFQEQGLGSWSEIKELQLDSPEMQPPAGCDTSSAKVDVRLKPDMVFEGVSRMKVDDRFLGVVVNQKTTSVQPTVVKSLLTLTQIKGVTTIQAGTTMEQTCTANGTGWGCTSTGGPGEVSLPAEYTKYNSCGIPNSTSYDVKYYLGMYSIGGKSYQSIMTRMTFFGDIVCKDTNTNMGAGSSTYVSFQSTEMISPTFTYSCRGTIAAYGNMKVGTKFLTQENFQTTPK